MIITLFSNKWTSNNENADVPDVQKSNQKLTFCLFQCSNSTNSYHMIQKENYKTMLNHALYFQHGRPVPDLLQESFSTHHLKIKVIYYIKYKTTTTIIIIIVVIIDYLGQYGFENEIQADAAFVISLNRTKQQQKKERDYRLLHELPIKTLSSCHSKNSERRSAAHK